MARQAIAVEFESTAVKVVHIRTFGKRWEVLHVAVKPLGEIARYPEGARRHSALTKLLMEALPPTLPKCSTIVSLSGRTSMQRYVHAPPVSERRLETLMTFEAESQAVGGQGSLAFDYLKLGLSGPGGTNLVSLTVAQTATLKTYEAICRDAGLSDISFCPSSFGLANAYMDSRPDVEAETALIVDIGANNLTMVLVENGQFLFSRTISGGGSRINQAIADAFGVSYNEAENIKRDRGRYRSEKNLDSLKPDEAKMHRAVSSALSIMGGAIESTLLYCRSQIGIKDLEVDRMFLCGGTSQLPGIEDAFSTKLGMPVQGLQPFSGTLFASEPEVTEAILSSTLGLALGEVGLGQAIDVRTTATREHENYRKHDHFVWIAAPVIGLILIIIAAGLFWFADSYKSYAESTKKKIALEEKVRSELTGKGMHLELLRDEYEFLLGKTSGPIYLIETMKTVKAVLENDHKLAKNKRKFETLFLERIYMGEKSKQSPRRDHRLFPRAIAAGESKEDIKPKYPPDVYLIGWCRDRMPSNAIEMVRQFCLEIFKNKKLVDDFTIRSLQQIKEEKPDKEWRSKPYLIQFEIVLKMKK